MNIPFEGCDLSETLIRAAKKYDMKFVIFTINNEKYEAKDAIGNRASDQIINLLLLTNNSKSHICYIKDIEGLTKSHICPKCHNFMMSNCDNGNYKKVRFDRHVETCDGTNNPKIKL
jgi:hypothetical protein